MRRNQSLGIFLIAIFIGVTFVFFIYSFISVNTNQLVSPLVSSQIKKNDNLEQAVKNALEGTTGSYAVGIKNLKNNQSYYQNEHRV